MTTVINLSKTTSNIQGFSALPLLIQRVIQRADDIQSYGHQELNGFKGDRLIWSASGYWQSEVFVVESLGWKITSGGVHYAWTPEKGVYQVNVGGKS